MLNTRHGNTRWLVSCSFQWRARWKLLSVRGQKRRERASRCLLAAGGFSSEKVGARRGEKKEEREREWNRVFDCVAFSLSRLFRNEYRQWPTQRRFFSWQLERRRVSFHFPSVHSLPSSPAIPSLRSFVPSLVQSHLSVVIEHNWNEVTECQYYVIGSCLLVSYLRTEFRCRLFLTPYNTKIPTRLKSSLNYPTSLESLRYLFFIFANKLIRELSLAKQTFFLNLSKLGARVHRLRGLAHIQKCGFQLDLAFEHSNLCQFFSPATRYSSRPRGFTILCGDKSVPISLYRWNESSRNVFINGEFDSSMNLAGGYMQRHHLASGRHTDRRETWTRSIVGCLSRSCV